MNRYRSGGASKATATTLCQKCLKRGHYSYECTASQQDRPYASRPSRTQQLANPKLAPKIVEATSKGQDSGREQKQQLDLFEHGKGRHSRSPSSSSSDSVSTISTNLSRSPSRSPVRDRRSSGVDRQHDSATREVKRRRRSRSRSRSPHRESERHRRRRSSASPTEAASGERKGTRASDEKDRASYRERSLSPYSKRRAQS